MNILIFQKRFKNYHAVQKNEDGFFEKKSAERKEDFISGRIALDRCLKKYAKERLIRMEVDILCKQREKPRLVFSGKTKNSQHGKIDFNISHSHGNSICFLCEKRMAGADLEKIRFFNNNLINGFLNEREKKLVNRKKRIRKKQITIFWSLKEAYLKAIGVGLKRNPREIGIYKLYSKKYLIKDGTVFVKSRIESGIFLKKFVWVTIKIQ